MRKLIGPGEMGDGSTRYIFHCPGCDFSHAFITAWSADAGRTEPKWSFNGDFEKPTFSPSLLYSGNPTVPRCHLFMVNGEIRFLDDCSHPFAGKTVPLGECE